MARREELLISRSRTLRSRRALAASSFICSSLLWPRLDFGGFGIVVSSGAGVRCNESLMLWGSSTKNVVDGSVRIEALRAGTVMFCFGRGLEMIELTLNDFP